MCAPDDEALLALAQRVVTRHMRQRPRLDVKHAEDMLSDALFGIAQALTVFDPDRGISFDTFAYHRASGSVLDGFRSRSPLSRGELRAGRTTSDTDLGPRRPLSLDDPRNPVPDLDPRSLDPFRAAEDQMVLAQVLARLRPRERQVIEDLYLRERTGLEIARSLGVTETRVSQIRKSALSQMRKHLAA